MRIFKISKRSMVISFALAFLLPLNGCNQVPIKNNEFCADAGQFGASCFHSLSDDERDIPKATWDIPTVDPSHRFGMVCTSTDAFTNWQKAIEILCQNHQTECDFETKQAIQIFLSKVKRTKRKVMSHETSH